MRCSRLVNFKLDWLPTGCEYEPFSMVLMYSQTLFLYCFDLGFGSDPVRAFRNNLNYKAY